MLAAQQRSGGSCEVSQVVGLHLTDQTALPCQWPVNGNERTGGIAPWAVCRRGRPAVDLASGARVRTRQGTPSPMCQRSGDIADLVLRRAEQPTSPPWTPAGLQQGSIRLACQRSPR